VVDPVKIFLASTLITMQNLVAVSHTLCMRVGGLKIFADAGARTPPPIWGRG